MSRPSLGSAEAIARRSWSFHPVGTRRALELAAEADQRRPNRLEHGAEARPGTTPGWVGLGDAASALRIGECLPIALLGFEL